MQDDDYALRMRQRTYFIHNLLFLWPIVNSDDDVQRVRLLDFRICMALALFNTYKGFDAYLMANTAVERRDAVQVLVQIVLFYVLGASGLRCGSVAAAVMLVVLQVIYLIEERIQFGHYPLDTILILALMLNVLRGIYLSYRWKPTNEPAAPLLTGPLFSLSLIGRWPRVVWPRLRWVFWLDAGWLTATALFYFYLAHGDTRMR